MKFCMLRNHVKQNGELKYTYQDAGLDLGLIEKYSKNLNMYFYQIKNMGKQPFIIHTGYENYSNEEFVVSGHVIDLGFAEMPNEREDFSLNKEEFLRIIDENIVSYDNWLSEQNHVKRSRI